MAQICLNCQKVLFDRKIDAKFCGGTCRTAFHRKKKKLELEHLNTDDAALEMAINKAVKKRNHEFEVEYRERFREQMELENGERTRKTTIWKVLFFVALLGVVLLGVLLLSLLNR